MGLKYTVETVGELRKALAHVPDDVPFTIVCDDMEFVKLDAQSLYDGKPECFVKMEATDMPVSPEHIERVLAHQEAVMANTTQSAAIPGNDSGQVQPPLTPLATLESICDQIFRRWDEGQRAGKLLTALAGRVEHYRADVDAVRVALEAFPDMLAALKAGLEEGQRQNESTPDDLTEFSSEVQARMEAAIAKAEAR